MKAVKRFERPIYAPGIGRLSDVARRILEQSAYIPGATRYTPAQVIEKVIYRQESVASSSSSCPSWLWCEAISDQGEPSIDGDLGKLPYMLPIGDGRRYAVNLPAYEAAEGPDGLLGLIGGDCRYGIDFPAINFMLEHGISIGERFLVEVSISYSQDYYGECDCDISSEVIYKEPNCGFIILPIPSDAVGYA
ncbi:hypothetical protein [Roseibium aggregatum]|uniref:Uncharacterized protein n=1 Tax=Roseibium aggregatum TaxID=187304 RepID=A0A0M6Y6J3_9HYPH|nr:hypothetical protein [Roseibium aggregatum]CTQ45726.1 hypothetical protein LAL4801_04181 [Roseibium aggregatum]